MVNAVIGLLNHVCVYNKALPCNTYLIHLVSLFHNQSNANEFLFRAYEAYLLYKKDQILRRNQQGRGHQGKQYVNVYPILFL